MVTDSRTLLSQYARTGSESAFRELVSRYIDLVYSTAYRLVDGDAESAKDVAQTVFVALANQARTLPENVMLGGWLHLQTRFAAGKFMRSERRRRSRERQAAEMNALEDHNQGNLAQIAPVLDEAIGQLDAEDRNAILLRFFERQDFRSVGDALRTSEDAARKRVARALEKLRLVLGRRGVTLSAAALGTTLTAEAVTAAPAGLASAIATASLSAAGSGAGLLYVLLHAARANWRILSIPGVALVIMLTVAIYHRTPSQNAPQQPAQVASPPVEPGTDPTGSEQPPPPAPAPVKVPALAENQMRFDLLDAETGAPIPAAKLRLVYFAQRGKSKTAKLNTDAQGQATIEIPQEPYTSVNLFVTADRHVPKVVSWNSDGFPKEYAMKLEAGSTVSGVVVDESQQPVPQATITFIGPGIDTAQKENIQFGPDTVLRTDADGRWSCSMIPQSRETIHALLEHPQFVATPTDIPVTNSQAKPLVLQIRRGLTVTGLVADTAGRPVAGAAVRELHDRQDRALSSTTDTSGRFEFRNLPAGDIMLAVQADGLAPAVLETKLSASPTELNFVLQPGRVLKGHVVDDRGTPVPNALAQTCWTSAELRKIEWSARTDSEGRFEWDSAPAEPLHYWFDADGFTSPPAGLLNADGSDHEIRLTRTETNAAPAVVRITGSVTDDQTGLPLDEFKVLLGEIRVSLSEPIVRFVADGKNGQFSFSLRPPFFFEAYQVQIQKDRYLPIASTNLLLKAGNQSLDLKMSKGSGPAGIVVLPGGETATNATVFLYEATDRVWMAKPGEFRKDTTSTTRVQTDATGRFSFVPHLQARGLIAIHDQGYAEVPLKDFAGTIVLPPWGRVEGKLTVAGRPGTNETICLGNTLYRYGDNGRRYPPLGLRLEATTDAQGTFAFEKVPPGEHKITHLLVRPGSQGGRIYDTHGLPVTVSAGTATRVELGGTGRPVIGKLSFSPASLTSEWQTVTLQLRLKLPGAPGSRPARGDYPTTDAYLQAWRAAAEAERLFWVSEQGRELERSERTYSGFCGEDASFSLPDIPPGAYDLRIEMAGTTRNSAGPSQEVPTVLLAREIVVPEVSPGQDNHALDLGLLELKAPGDLTRK
ncbi:MAG TPA: sigma-70 family RNA polymerase sigma factor [Candidatus Paceibacterota bacterium]|nr:sigma-70 family RNA polymerase sigma factor [Verrucomicrobiota bacterium]HSA12257.1 sigma-70 family RNA polymerase sigma factor [Candidatus Paceibacterota bacterium]